MNSDIHHAKSFQIIGERLDITPLLTAYCQEGVSRQEKPMRRADRLFQIIQILQRSRRVTTAQDIAEELEVSARTIYRDIRDLMMNRVPIRGEAGSGYILEQGYDLPPLMFNEEEIDAIMLGVHWVHANGDPDIRRASRDVFRKIEAVIPKERRDLLQSARHIVPEPVDSTVITISMP
ncbi:MAG: HTH domain-containing protein, partial [Sneathiellales bacterium]|nr:HTH domain-containing protein [Sneathiellales bacterium]